PEEPLRLKPSDSNPGRLPALSQTAPHPSPTAATAAVVRPATKRSPRLTAAPVARPKGRGRGPLLAAAVLLPVLAAAAAAVVFWLPRVEKQRAGQRVQTDALADRRFVDAASGLTLTVPDGWYLLRPDSTLLVAPQSRAKLAHPGKDAFAVLTLEAA